MADYAAFLRGVNLGAVHRVSSAELRELFERMGLGDVGTFRTSGNVVFSAGGEARAALAARIEAGLEKELGYPVATFVRSADEVRTIAGHRPFDAGAVEASKGKLQVSLLADRPAAGARKQVLAHATDQDRLAFGERELYWLPSGGTMDSSLDLQAIDKLLGPTTRRTMGTIEQLAAKYF